MNLRPLCGVLLAASCVFCRGADVETPVSLDDCLKMALESNLEIRVAKYSPMLGTLALQGDFGAYDPNFRMNAQRSYRASEGFGGVGAFNTLPNESEVEQLSGGLGGLLPTGMQYDMTASTPRNGGSQVQLDPFGRPYVVEIPWAYTPSILGTASQPLLRNAWIDQARLTIQLDRKNLLQNEADFRRQLITTVTDVTIAYHNLIEARENVRVQEKALELAVRAWRENQKRVEVGAMAPLEEKQSEAQVKRSEADLISARQQLATAQNALKRLLSDDFAALDGKAFTPTASLQAIPEAFDKKDSWHKGLTLRPDLRRAQVELEKQKITLRFNRNQLFPQLDIFASYGLNGQDVPVPSRNPATGQISYAESGSQSRAWRDISGAEFPNYTYGLRLNVPLSNRRARMNYQSSKLLNERLLLDYKRLEQDVMVEIDNAILTARTAFERVSATEAARDYADQAWEAEKKKLENGKSTSFVVLQLQRDLIAAESAAVTAKSDYNKAIARLAQSEGFTLERYKVNLNIR